MSKLVMEGTMDLKKRMELNEEIKRKYANKYVRNVIEEIEQ